MVVTSLYQFSTEYFVSCLFNREFYYFVRVNSYYDGKFWSLSAYVYFAQGLKFLTWMAIGHSCSKIIGKDVYTFFVIIQKQKN